MLNQKKAGLKKLSGKNKISLNAGRRANGYEERRCFMLRAMKSMPWLICASAAWLTLVPCEMAFAVAPPDDNNVLYNKIGEDAGGTIAGGQLDIDQSEASKAVSERKWYFTSNWAKAGNATEGHTTIQSGVTIGDNSGQQWYISGSLSSNGVATNSYVTATSATVNGDIIGGDGHSSSSYNIVETTGTAVTRSVIGGRVQDDIGENDDSSNNGVSMSAGSSAYQVIGGYTLYGNAIRNKVSLEGESHADIINGGYSSNGKANTNEVHLNNSSSSMVFGGGDYQQKGDVLNNIVTLENGSETLSVYGGFTSQGNADGNQVYGSDSRIPYAAYGGWGTTGASNNIVKLSNVTVGIVTGGKTTSGAASGNEVDLSNGTTFSDNLYAGYTDDGDAIGNKLTLTGISEKVYDIYSSFTKNGQAGGEVTLTNSLVDNVYGAVTESGVASGSTVKGKDSTVGGSVYGGHGTTGASSNTVNLDNVQVTGSVSGGYTDSGDAADNAVTLSNRTTFTGDLYASYTENGNATGNEVSLYDVSAPGNVYASYTANGQAGGIDDDTRSKVTITKSSVTGSVYGGYTASGTANYSNVVIIDSTFENTGEGTAASRVYAGYTKSGEASHNQVTVSGATTSIQGDVYGGYTGSGTANSNSVTVNDSTINSNVYAGYTWSGEASHNQVTVSGANASIQGRVYGGYGSLDTSYNTVELSDGAYVGDDVVGGHSAGDSATRQNVLHNEVTVSSGSRVDGGLYGGVITEGLGTVQYNTVNLLDNASVGYDVVGGGVLLDAPTGTVENNAVNISAGTVEGSVYGGAFEYSVSRDPGNSDIMNNAVILSEGAVVNGSVFGGYSAGIGDVTGNRVFVSGSSRVDGDVYGGMAEGNDASNPGSASQNKVRIEGGSTVGGSVYGGWNSNGETVGNFIYVDGTVSKGVTAGYTLSGDAAGNEVLVEGGTVLDHLYGGYTALGSATGNVITVKGGTVNAEIAGGYDDGTATDNTVTLYDSARFTGSDIYGGKSGGSSTDVFTGNTFNVYGQIDASSLQNFQNLNFYDVADDTASVALSRSAVIGDGKGSMTNVYIGNLRNQEGDIPDEYVLIHTPTASSSYTGTNLYVNGNTIVTIGPDGSYIPYSGTVANDGTMDNATGSTGMTKTQTLTKGFLTFEVDYFIKNGQDLIARWKKDAPVEVNSETEEFTASRQASAALMDEGADFVAGEGIDRALQASQCLPGEPCGAKAFVAVNGGYSTYKAGTTFDISYGNMLAGIARQCKIGPVGYLAGVFFETGLGRFHSEYEPDDSRSIDSEGHDYYYGVGALAKVFLNRDLLKGLYAEGSIRYGLMMGDWQSHDIQADGQTADWDGRAPYLTAHGGLGYMWNVTDNVTADVYAKYFWGHLWGDDGTICGQQFEFDDIYSSRVRTGARLNFKKDETFSWYLGGAWEHQFDAKSTGSIYGYDVPSTDLRGNTAIAEAGVFFKPAADSDFSFMLGTTGYFGEKREGVTGHLQVRYDF